MGEHKKVQVWIYRKKPDGSPDIETGSYEVLLLRTIAKRGSFWQPVTGSVEKGETVAAAALREAREETGLAFAHEIESLDKSFVFESPRKEIEEHGFALRAPDGGAIKMDPREHDDHQWVTPEAALKLVYFSSNADMLRILMARLKKNEPKK